MSKPDLTHLRLATATYVARAAEHGSAKPGRSRGDYLAPLPREAALWRLRDDLRAMIGHALRVLDGMDRNGDPGARDEESGLLHLAHVAGRANTAIAGAVASGLLPEDPAD